MDVWNLVSYRFRLTSRTETPRVAIIDQEADLHIFSDASNKAYGACAYLSCNGQGNLIMGKAKVAPLKNLTIPKLELTAVLLAARLTKFIHDAYKGIIKIKNSPVVW